MTIIAGIISIALGVFLWMLPPLRYQRVDGKFVLQGDRKRIIAWLFIMSGIVNIILQIHFFMVFLIAIVLVFIATFSAERDQQVRAAFQPPPPRPTPRPVVRPAPQRPTPERSQSSPALQPLTPQLLKTLTFVTESGTLSFDYINKTGDVMHEQCRTLVKMGYLTSIDSGPGGSFEVFMPTDAAWEVLTAPKPESAQPPAEPSPQPLTPELRMLLESIVGNGSTFFDRRYQVDQASKQRCETLVKMGYLTVSETGPGGSVDLYKPTQAGRDIIMSFSSTPPKPPTEPSAQPLTPELRATLLEVIEKGKLEFDLNDDSENPAFQHSLELEKLGYLLLTETDFGGSKRVFRPTAAGRAARSAPPPGTPRPAPPPPNPSLTDELRGVLQWVVLNARVSFDTRFKSSDEKYLACKKLSNMGYLAVTFDGPGDAIEFYAPTDKGRKASGI